MKFRGNFPAKVDSQGRLKIPTAHLAVFNEHYGAELFVTSYNGDHIILYPKKEWEQIEAQLLEKQNSKVKRKFLKYTGYWGQEAALDKQGRVLLHPHLRSAAGIDGEVAVIGNLTHLAIWNNESLQQSIESEPFTEEELEQLGI